MDYTAFGDFEIERLGTASGQVADNSLVQLFRGSFEGIENLLLSDGNDEFYGSGTSRLEIFGAGGDDRMIRNQGNDGGAQARFHGGDGDDYIEFNTDGNEAYGDAGDDWLDINVSTRDAIVKGGSGDDYMRITRMYGTVDGGSGYDRLSIEAGGTGTRTVVDLLLETAQAFNFSNVSQSEQQFIGITELRGVEEVIGGDEERDTFAGSNEGDRFITRGGADTLLGRAGNDELFDGDGADRLEGGTGNDLLHGGAGNDILIGGTLRNEIDTASYANTRFEGETGEIAAGDFGAVTVNLSAGRASGAQGNDTLESIENAIGSSADDVLLGDGQDNVLSGGSGNDRLEGSGGDDVLILGSGNDMAEGGSGDDTIIIGLGDATVNGGTGRDLVDFGLVDGSVNFDFNDLTYVAMLVQDIPAWRDTGTFEARTWNGTVLTPQDVIEAEASFANSADDLTRAVPQSDDPDADLFEVVFTQTTGRYSGTLANIEEVATGAGNDTLLGTEGANWMAGGAGDDLMLGGAAQMISAQSSDAKIFRIYQATLARFPDSGGFDGWVEAIDTGARTIAQVTGAFVASAEFQATYGPLGNGDFVDLLCQNVLGREGDQASRDTWVLQLESGALDRADVVQGFSQSREFINNTSAPLLAFMRQQTGDTMRGGAGNDMLAGEIASDVFEFNVLDMGRDAVLSLDAWDTVAFTDFGYATADQAHANMRQAGSDVLFSDEGVVVSFNRMTLEEMDAILITV